LLSLIFVDNFFLNLLVAGDNNYVYECIPLAEHVLPQKNGSV